jgi:hypothetical protein
MLTMTAVLISLVFFAEGESLTDQFGALSKRFVELKNSRHELSVADLPRPTYLERLAEKRRESEALAADLITVISQLDVNNPVRYIGLDIVLLDRHCGSANYDKAAELLLEDETRHYNLPQLCYLIAYSYPGAPPEGEKLLRKLIDKSENPEVIAMASLSLARMLRVKINEATAVRQIPSRRALRLAEMGDGYVRDAETADLEAAREEAGKLLTTIEQSFGDLEYRGRKLRVHAAEEREYFEHQTVGSTAHDITGTDTNEASFKLSDSDNRIRAVLFSGLWCVGCRADYPRHNAVIAKYPSDQFVFVGVNSDEKLSTIQDAIRSGEVTWRCWWDGAGTPLTIHKEWKLQGAPHLFVLDGQRRIRFSDIDAEELDEAIQALLSEK